MVSLKHAFKLFVTVLTKDLPSNLDGFLMSITDRVSGKEHNQIPKARLEKTMLPSTFYLSI